MDIKKTLADLSAEASALAQKAAETPDEFTDTDAARAEEIVAEHTRLKAMLGRQEEVAKSLAAVTAQAKPQDPDPIDAAPEGGSLGRQFVRSKAMSDFRAHTPHLVDGQNVNVAVKTAERRLHKAATVNTESMGLDKRPAFTDNLVYRPALTLLDLIYTGTVDEGYLPYRQIVSMTAGAKVVGEAKDNEGTGVEGGVKPLSQLTTQSAEGKVHTYADGVEITNAEFADDGAMVSIIDGMLTYNVNAEVERVLLNGTGTGVEPKGLLTTSGVLQQDWATDILTSIRKAKTKLTKNNAPITAIALNPEDEEALDLVKDSDGRFLGAGPFAAAIPTVWGVPRVTSAAIPQGKALIGNFASVQLLIREALNILVFNQHKDYAQRNLLYVRAELRAMQLFRAPGHLCLVDVKGS